MKARGVVANIQPQFVPTDARWLPEKLPPQLLTHAYAWKTLLDNGTFVIVSLIMSNTSNEKI